MKAPIYFLLALLLLTSCRTRKSSTHSTTQHETRTITQYSVIERPQAGKVDTLILTEELPIEVPLIIEDTASKTQLRIIRDKYDRLQATCISTPDPVQIDCPPCEQLEREIVIQQIEKKTITHWPWWLYALLGIGVVSTTLHFMPFVRRIRLRF